MPNTYSDVVVEILREWNDLLRAREDTRLPGVDDKTLRNWFSWDKEGGAEKPPKKKPTEPTPANVFKVVLKTWQLLSGDANRSLRKSLLEIIREHVSIVKVEDIAKDVAELVEDADAQVVAGFLKRLREKKRDAPSPATPTKNVQAGLLHCQSNDRGNPELYKSFWSPFLKPAAIVGVWAPNHHYDLVPMCLLARHVAAHIDPDVEFLFFDENGRALCPDRPPYDTFQAYCFLGRLGLYTSFPFFESIQRKLLEFNYCSLPAVSKETRRHLKRKLSPEFHRIDNHSGKGPAFFFAEDRIDSSAGKRHRTDYALIQRLYLPEKNTSVVILAGCTALGTMVAVEHATRFMFPSVRGSIPLKGDDNAEILLRVNGSLDWSDQDAEKLQKGELLTKPWQDVSSVPWCVCVNGEAHHRADGALDMSSRDALLSAFLFYRDSMLKRYRYFTSKYAALLGEKWPAVRQVVVGNPIAARIGYVEVHPSEPCQLGCKYCRGGLREVPTEPKHNEHLLTLIREIHKMNPSAFIRFSGTIGEPLLHKDIAKAFALLNSEPFSTLHWGLTTNGLLLNKSGIMKQLMGADYVHVSLDAGSASTYEALKGGSASDFEKVLQNIRVLATFKRTFDRSPRKQVEIVVSFLLQKMNYPEIPDISKKLKEIGADTFELKMQHFHRDRHMTEEQIEEAYKLIREVREKDDCSGFRVLFVQSEEEALEKIARGAKSESGGEVLKEKGGSPSFIDFRRCYANQLGLNVTIDSRGQLQTCCQYYQKTLGVQARDARELSKVWNSPERAALLQRDPHDSCINCSPSDEFVNRLVQLLYDGYRKDSSFLSWVEDNFVTNQSGAVVETG